MTVKIISKDSPGHLYLFEVKSYFYTLKYMFFVLFYWYSGASVRALGKGTCLMVESESAHFDKKGKTKTPRQGTVAPDRLFCYKENTAHPATGILFHQCPSGSAAMFQYTLINKDPSCQARRGRLETPRGVIETPTFMPVGTHAAMKAMTPAQVEETGSRIILANTYHLHLKPGEELVRKAGGLHSFMAWQGPILTDSGGFQVFSLPKKKITEDGVFFRHEVTGEEIFIGPKEAMAIQNALGADKAFDAPIPSTIYTFPEIAAVGMTAAEARNQGLPISVGNFPLGTLGKAMAVGDRDGFVKVVRHRETGQLLGVHMMGHNVTEVIAAAGAMLHEKVSVEEMAEVVFAHPTISEGLKEGAEDALSMALHMAPRKVVRAKV